MSIIHFMKDVALVTSLKIHQQTIIVLAKKCRKFVYGRSILLFYEYESKQW